MIRDPRTVVGTAFTVIGIVLIILVLIGVMVYVGNRIDFEGDGDRPKLSERQKAVRDAVAPCPGQRAAAVDVDEDDIDVDVKVRCAP